MPLKTTELEKMKVWMKRKGAGWAVKIENDKLRIFCNVFIVDWKGIEEFASVFNMRIDDVIAHNAMGVVISMDMQDGI